MDNKLDEIIKLKKSELVIVDSPLGDGKTSFVITLIQDMVFKKKLRLGIFSLEMSGKSLMQKILEPKVEISFSKLTDRVSALYDAPLFVDDTVNISISELIKSSRLMVEDHSIEVLIIDQIGLIQLTAIMESLKQLTLELQIPVIVLSKVSSNSKL